MKKQTDFNNYIKLSIQRALLGNVTNNMRAITAELSENNIKLFFIMMVKYMKMTKKLFLK